MLCMSGCVYVRGMNLLVWEHAEARSCHLDVLHSSFSTFSSEPRSLRDLGLTSLPRLVLTHQHWHQLQPCPALHFGSRHSNLGHPCLHNKHFNPQSSFQPQNQSNKIQWFSIESKVFISGEYSQMPSSQELNQNNLGWNDLYSGNKTIFFKGEQVFKNKLTKKNRLYTNQSPWQ